MHPTRWSRRASSCSQGCACRTAGVPARRRFPAFCTDSNAVLLLGPAWPGGVSWTLCDRVAEGQARSCDVSVPLRRALRSLPGHFVSHPMFASPPCPRGAEVKREQKIVAKGCRVYSSCMQIFNAVGGKKQSKTVKS